MRRRSLFGGLVAGAAGALAAPPAARATATGGRVSTGLEMLIGGGYRDLRGRRVGVVTNPDGRAA
ncbi:hypothetical protein GCM10022224_054980 [Nonomuraea antimicrobica]|uniref:Uncharacterized protein n=1 Tax=Nonomuraea antimicrobica TaxID=561173 RepID=A0ABP7C8F4_9ACTN